MRRFYYNEDFIFGFSLQNPPKCAIINQRHFSRRHNEDLTKREKRDMSRLALLGGVFRGLHCKKYFERGNTADALKALLTPDVAGVYVQQPNFYGLFEETEAIGELVHGNGSMYILGCNPIALAVMKTPRDCGADIAVGEGQPLGMPLSWGGPYLGFMATTAKHMRKLPGRIVGETVDSRGGRAYVLSLQAREQHIRREKASSNICSNQALCALTAGVYMAAMGPGGMAQAAKQSMAKAHYLAEELCKLDGVRLKYSGAYFHEFVTVMPKAEEVLKALENAGILGGLPVDGGILWCATEKVSREELDRTVSIVKEVLGA